MSETTTNNSLVVETPRGPSIAGTRITIYSIMDSIKAGWSREEILQVMTQITAAQLDAVYEYIGQHREQVEQAYERILRRSAEARAKSDQIWRERSPFPPGMPWEERRKLMIQKLEAMKKADQAQNGNHNLR
jgi:uncharacterized protein (DUF433 family)